MGQVHWRALSLHGYEITTIDPDPERGAYPSQLAAPPAEVVAIAVPPSELVTQAELAIELGAKTIMVEKPFALSLEDGERIVELANSKGVNLGVGYIERANPAVEALRANLHRVGSPLVITGSRLGPAPGRPTAGPVLDLLTHDLNVLAYLGFEPSGIAGTYVTDSLARAFVRASGGIAADLVAGYESVEKVRTLRVTGDQGSLDLDYQAQTVQFNGHNLFVTGHEPLMREWTALLKGKPYSTGEDALQTLSLALEINGSRVPA